MRALVVRKRRLPSPGRAGRRLIEGCSPYAPGSPASRATLFSLIVVAHVGGIIAISGVGTTTISRPYPALTVRLTPEVAAPRRFEPAQSVPLPKFRTPEVPAPPAPVVEITYPMKAEEPVVAAATPMNVLKPIDTAPAPQPPRVDVSYLDNPAPAYPPLSRRLGEQGRVLLRVLVDAAGNVEAVEIQNSSGHRRLDEAAAAVVRRWRFLPARHGGRPVIGWALVPVQFELQS